MIVVSLSPRKKFLCAVAISPPPDPEEFETCFEGDKLLLDRRVLERCGIVAGQELSEDELLTLIKGSECFRAKQRALWCLSRSDFSSKGLYNKLKKDFKEYAAEYAVARMSELGYINDQDYATRLAASLLQYQGLSKRAAQSKMLQKGVEKELANEVLDSFETDPKEQVLKLINKKYKNKLSNEDDKRRTVAALQRRGFSFSDIRAAMQQLDKELEYFE